MCGEWSHRGVEDSDGNWHCLRCQSSIEQQAAAAEEVVEETDDEASDDSHPVLPVALEPQLEQQPAVSASATVQPRQKITSVYFRSLNASELD
eukprot:255779-Amphidinium_carterae.1